MGGDMTKTTKKLKEATTKLKEKNTLTSQER